MTTEISRRSWQGWQAFCDTPYLQRPDIKTVPELADMEENEVEWIEGMLRDIDKERKRRGLPPLVEEGAEGAREAEGGYTPSEKEQQYPKAEFADEVHRPQTR